MNARFLLGLAMVAAGAVAACGAGDNGSSLSSGGLGPGQPDVPSGNGSKTDPGKGAPTTPGSTPPPAQPGNLPTNSKAGKAFFAASVAPFLEQKCSTCHAAGGIGNPTWLVKGDPSKTYDSLYLNGYVIANSRIVVKGVHSGGSAPDLTVAEKTTFAQWVTMEATDGGQKSQTNVLEKFGTCFDKAKFDAIGFGNLVTTRRQAGNNPQNQTENANNCTGCNNTKCNTCHSADDVTGFVMAIGNPQFTADYTFERSKLVDPAFIRQYVSTTPTGEPQFNPGIMTKSTNTIQKAPAYSHPMFILTPVMQTAIQAFVDDAIAKQKAGSCGK